MDIVYSERGPITVLAITGAIVTGELEPLETRLAQCVDEECRKIILAIEKVPFIDSNGLDMILNFCLKLGKRHGHARIAEPNEICRDIFIATRLSGFVQVYNSVDEAAQSLA